MPFSEERWAFRELKKSLIGDGELRIEYENAISPTNGL